MVARPDIDLNLIEAFKNGESDAFDDLMLRHRRRLVRLITRMTKDRWVAEDIAQETFLKVYLALPKFRGDSRFSTWVYRIAVNTLISQKTIAQRQSSIEHPKVLGPSETHFGWESDVATPASILESKQTLAILGAVLNRMESIFSEPLLMFEIDGMTYVQIASVTACPVGTVRSRIARGRAFIAAKVCL